MMLSAENILQALSTIPEEQKTIFLQAIQQGSTVGNINTTGETTRTRRRPVRTCTLTYKERGCIQYMTSTYTIHTESIGELAYNNTLSHPECRPTRNSCPTTSHIIIESAKFLRVIDGIQYYETTDGHVWMFTKDGELECLTHSESYRVRD